MEIEQLQEQWTKHYEKLNSNQLILKTLLRASKESKIANQLKKMQVYSILFMVFNLSVVIGSWLVLVNHISNSSIFVQMLVLIALSKIAFIQNTFQLSRISKIHFSKPILEVQKHIERLKLQRIKFMRYIFVFCMCYFWLIVAMLFEWDLIQLISIVWINAPSVVVFQLGFCMIWFPLSLWMLKQYDKNSTSAFWKFMGKDSYLTDDSLNVSLNKAMAFLNEMERFEKEV